MFKKENGITLVALVVTIIVLLILAGVSITMVVGDSGVAEKAKEAASSTEIANAQDAINLAISSAQLDLYSGFADGSTTTMAKQTYTVKAISDKLTGYTLTVAKPGEQPAAGNRAEGDAIEDKDVGTLTNTKTSKTLKVTFTVNSTSGAMTAVVAEK